VLILLDPSLPLIPGMNDRMNVGMFELGMKRGSLGRNGGMGSRENLGLRVGLMLGFVGS
jgi:hypothetical protein